MSKEQLAVWLIPSQKSLPPLSTEVNRLASAHNAPLFVPHTTLFVAQIPESDVPSSISYMKDAGKSIQPFSLRSEGVGQTGFLFKTLFIQFGMTDELMKLYESMKTRFEQYSDKPEDVYTLNPHMSLLYKELPVKTRKSLADSYTPPTEVEFDTLGYHLLKDGEEPTNISKWDVQFVEKNSSYVK